MPEMTLGAVAQPIIRTARQAFYGVPSWILLAMILLAGVGICSAVVVKARAQRTASAVQHGQMASEIEVMRRTNVALQAEIRRMTTEPATIELAARERLGMVRPTDIVVPVQTRPKTNLATLSFVR